MQRSVCMCVRVCELDEEIDDVLISQVCNIQTDIDLQFEFEPVIPLNRNNTPPTHIV